MIFCTQYEPDDWYARITPAEGDCTISEAIMDRIIHNSYDIMICIKRMDYSLALRQLKEADELCHGNWIEIQNLHERVELLERLLIEAGIDFSPEF